MTFQPLLAAKLDDPANVQFPVVASPKIDGVRCIIRDGVALSRKLKPFPAQWLQVFAFTLKQTYDADWDGEILAGDFQTTQSKCMTHGVEPFNFDFWVFDVVAGASYVHRLNAVHKAFWERPFVMTQPPNIAARALCLESFQVNNRLDLAGYHAHNLERGFEGTMLRHLNGPYKYGRSTVKEGTLLKYKPMDDSEFVVVDCFEEMENTNEAVTDERGYMKRSHEKAGMKGKGVLGGLVCTLPLKEGGGELIGNRPTFKVGSGFTAAQRAELWEVRDTLKGRVVTVQHQGYGSKGRPRFPVFKGFRPEVE